MTGAAAASTIFWRQPVGIFSGSRPVNLGYAAGKFAPPSWKPYTVSSTVEPSDKHYIEPLPFTGTASTAWKRLRAIVASSKGAAIVTDGETYLYAEFSSGQLGFVDDVEFAIGEKAGVIHARSGSRLGIDDLGVNRKRIEKIRQEFLNLETSVGRVCPQGIPSPAGT